MSEVAGEIASLTIMQGDNTPAEIRFYRAVGPNGFLSNLWRCHVEFEGILFDCSERAYQYGKPSDTTVRDWLLAAPTPSLCAQVAHGLFSWQVRPDWNDVKVDRMRQVLRAKFEQNPDLAVKLAETGDATLTEASSFDAYWGVGKKGTGKNMLGILLMEIRASLRPQVPKGHRIVADAVVHDYRTGQRAWGHDLSIEPGDGGLKASIVGHGRGLQKGHFLLLSTSSSPTGESLYVIRTIKYFSDPSDMWKAECEWAQRLETGEPVEPISAIDELREASKGGWDRIADPEAYINDMRNG